jgi:hypothetical protein
MRVELIEEKKVYKGIFETPGEIAAYQIGLLEATKEAIKVQLGYVPKAINGAATSIFDTLLTFEQKEIVKKWEDDNNK